MGNFLDIAISIFFLLVMMGVFIMTAKSVTEARIIKSIDRLKWIDSTACFKAAGTCDPMTEGRILQVLNVLTYDELAYLFIKMDDLDPDYRKKLSGKIALSRRMQNIKEIALSSRNKEKRLEAIDLMGRLRSDSFLQVLADIIASCADEDVAYVCIQSMGRNDSSLSARMLVSLLGSDRSLNARIASIVEGFGPSVFGEIISRKDDANCVVKTWVATILGRFPGDATFRVLCAMANDTDPDVRASAVSSIGKINYAGAADILGQKLFDDAWFVRLHAVKAIGAMLIQDGARMIIPLLRDHNWYVRNNAKKALKLYGMSAVPYLRPLLADNERFVRNAAVEILEDIGYAKGVVDAYLVDRSVPATREAFMEIINSEGFNWLKSRLSETDQESRKLLVKAMVDRAAQKVGVPS